MGRKNRFIHDDEENEEITNPGEALTMIPPSVPVKDHAEEKGEEAPAAPSEPSAEVVEEVPEPPKEEEPTSEPEPISNILADLIPQEKKPKPSTYGFYLDGDVHDELVRLAKQNKVNKSKFLNKLLRRVLFNE